MNAPMHAQMTPAALNSITSDATLVIALLALFDGDIDKQKAAIKDCRYLDMRKIMKGHTRIGLYDQLSIIGNATEILGSGWMFRSPLFWEKALDNVFCSALRTAPTLGEAIDMLAHYGFLWSPALYFESYYEEKVGLVFADVIKPAGLDDTASIGLEALKELALIATYLILDETLKGRWTKARVFVQRPKPDRGNFSKFFKTEIVWNAPRNGIELPNKLHRRKSRAADPAKFRKTSLFIQNLIHPADPDRSLEESVSAYINATHFHRPTIGEVSKSLGMSTRTLNRRLEETGVSFRILLEQSLQYRTQLLLNQGQLSRGEIAERLGYKDQASFSRALRRWQGETR